MIKPDAMAEGHAGKIITRFENAGFNLKYVELKTLTRAQCEVHYAQHVGKPFFERLVKYMTSGPILGMLISGPDAITRVREMAGATDPKKAKPGTIRFDYAKSIENNAIHTSDSPQAVEREFKNIFPTIHI